MRRNDRTVKIALIAFLSLMMLLPVPYYLYSLGQKTLLSAVTHHFYHANIFHLTLNCIAVWVSFGVRTTRREIITVFIIGSISYLFATRPVIGISNILFADAGFRSARYGKEYWKSANTIVFLSVMFAMLLFPQFSASTHIASFLLALAAERLVVKYKGLYNDFSRYI